jgi:hypothetical protein
MAESVGSADRSAAAASARVSPVLPPVGGPAGLAPPRGWRGRPELRALLEIVALCGLAITQPLLDVTGKSPDFFLFHRANTADILLLVAAFTLLPPLVVWGAGALTRLAGPVVRSAVHTATLGVLLAALAVQVGKHLLPLRGLPLALLAAGAGAGGAYAYWRWPAAGQLLRVAAAGPLVFGLLFVVTSPASAVVLPGERSGAGPGLGRGGGALHPPVVLLVLDELPLISLLGPDGAIDAQRFPHFARLATQSTWYRNATGVSGWTPHALPAMLTGRYPARGVAPHYSQYPDNLFTALGGIYDIRAQETVTQLCPPSRCGERTGANRGGLPVLLRESARLLERIMSPTDIAYDPQASYREAIREETRLDAQQPAPADQKFRWDSLNDSQPARFTQFLAGLRPANRPTVHFLHLLMPHTPWAYLPSGARYDAPEDLPNDGDGWVTLGRERHLAQLGYTDRLIGETLRVLEESGLYRDALVAVTADHGVSFALGHQGRSIDAVRRAPGEVLWVPMFVKEPGQRSGRVDDRNWEHVDLLPTIADLANVELPWRPDGISAVRAVRDRPDKRYYDLPGQRVDVPGPATFAAVTGGVARPPGRPELVGRLTAELPVVEAGETATVTNLPAFGKVDPAEGRVPALVYGTVPASVRTGTRLAVAVNGRIGAVVPVVDPDRGGRRFAALVGDDSLFNPGANRLEIFAESGGTLRRLRV